MSVLEKYNYLLETKQIFREKLDPDGTIITDSTPFRQYAEYICAKGYIEVSSVEELEAMQAPDGTLALVTGGV